MKFECDSSQCVFSIAEGLFRTPLLEQNQVCKLWGSGIKAACRGACTEGHVQPFKDHFYSCFISISEFMSSFFSQYTVWHVILYVCCLVLLSLSESCRSWLPHSTGRWSWYTHWCTSCWPMGAPCSLHNINLRKVGMAGWT